MNAGGLGGAITVAAFAMSYDKMLNEARAVAATFKTVTRMTSQANGGVGNLQTAVDSIEARLRAEQKKIEKIVTAQKKLGEFIVHTVKTDTRVAVMVAINREMFYLVNPWARPSFANFVRKVIKIAGRTIEKFFNAVQQFYRNHKKSIQKLAITGIILLGLGIVTYFCPAIAPLTTMVIIDTLSGIVVEGIFTAVTGGSAGDVFDAAASGAFKGVIEGFFDGAAVMTGFTPLSWFGGAAGTLVDGLFDGKKFSEMKGDLARDLFFGIAFGLAPASVGRTAGEIAKQFGEKVAQGLFQNVVAKVDEAIGNAINEVIKKSGVLQQAFDSVKEFVNSNVIGVKKDGQIWDGYQAMNVEFTHNFKEFVAEKYDLPVLPGGVAPVDRINNGLHNIGNSNAGSTTTVTGHSHGGEAVQQALQQLKPDLPQAIINAGHSIGEVIHSIIHPTPLPVPTPVPPIDIRDIIRPVHINININVIFKPTFFGAVVA